MNRSTEASTQQLTALNEAFMAFTRDAPLEVVRRFLGEWQRLQEQGIQINLDEGHKQWVVSECGPTLYIALTTHPSILRELERHPIHLEYLPRYIRAIFPHGTKKEPAEPAGTYTLTLPDGYKIAEVSASYVTYSSILVLLEDQDG